MKYKDTIIFIGPMGGEGTYDNRLEMRKSNRQLCLKRNTGEAFLKSYVELIEILLKFRK